METTTRLSIELNGAPHEVTTGTTLYQLVAAFAKTPKGVAVERNGEIVPRSSHASVSVADGDRIELVQFVGGG